MELLLHPLQPERLCVRTSVKAPKMVQTYELFAVQLELYLTPMNAWRVLTGDEVRPTADPAAEVDWDERDREAKTALRNGMPSLDAVDVCELATSAKQWRAFTDIVTKRKYGSVIDARRQFGDDLYTPGRDMEAWLQGLKEQRRNLAKLGCPVSD